MRSPNSQKDETLPPTDAPSRASTDSLGDVLLGAGSVFPNVAEESAPGIALPLLPQAFCPNQHDALEFTAGVVQLAPADVSWDPAPYEVPDEDRPSYATGGSSDRDSDRCLRERERLVVTE